MMPYLWILAGTVAALAAFTLVLFVRGVGNAFARGTGLDIAVSIYTWLPPVTGAIVAPHLGGGAWWGAAVAFAAQIVVLLLFCVAHAAANPDAGPTIRATLNRLVGSWRNYAALGATCLAFPAFWVIRVTELFAYPWLVVLLRFPRYNTSEWINVSRQKFGGLVGHDLVWCLYCDWMTGVYSLGAEMLRNVESFWCPIRFYGKKCDRCVIEFPDIKKWAPTDATMTDVVAILDREYVQPDRRSWFGHVERGSADTTDGAAKKPAAAAAPDEPAS